MPDKFPMDEVYPPPPRSGWNWGGCLVLAVILAVLVGLLLPMVGVVKSPAKQSWCGKNQSQIYGAMIAYATSEEVGFLPRHLLIDPQFTGATRGRFITTKVFESLSVSLSIGSSLFRCPSSAVGGPNKRVKPDPGNPASTWGWGETNGMTYAFDWAAPSDPSSSRVIMADRNPKAHMDYVMVTFGDAHVKKVKWLPSVRPVVSALITEDIDGKPIQASTGVAPDDDIFSTAGDVGEPLTEDKGDPLRAWVK